MTPSLLRRLGSLLYDGLTLVALWFLAAAVFTSLFGQVSSALYRWVLQGICLGVIAAYYLWCWRRSGQTLAMKTWRIRLVRIDQEEPAPLVVLMLRFALAVPSILLGGLGLWWAVWDPDGQFLHDRLAKTRLMQIKQEAPETQAG